MKLYHYTNFDSLKQIIHSSSLKMSSIKNVKDPLEVKNVVDATVEEYYKAKGVKLSCQYKKIIEELRKNTFCACFSETNESSYLYNEYAKPDGVIVEVEIDRIPHTMTAVISGNSKISDTCNLVKMKYEPFPFHPTLEHYDMVNLYFNACFTKSDNFSKEKEIRLLYHPDSSGKHRLGQARIRKISEYPILCRSIRELDDHLEYIYANDGDKERSLFIIFGNNFGSKTFYLSNIFLKDESKSKEQEIKNLLAKNGYQSVDVKYVNF